MRAFETVQFNGPDTDETAPIPAGRAMERPGVVARLLSLMAVVVPFLALVAAAILFWGTGFSWVHLGLLLGGYVVTALGVTVGFHRLFTHRSFRTNAVMRAILGIMGSTSVEGPLMTWVATHRQHHQYSDRPDDPHSPNTEGTGLWAMVKGIWHAHMGWFFESLPADMDRYVPDLKADAVTRVVSNWFVLWAALGIAIPGVIALCITGTWMGALLGLIWGGLLRVFFVHHVTWSINSICHVWGQRPFDTSDLSRNNVVFGVLGMGEGWHNNHHAFPASARHGLEAWQLDISYLVIRGLAMVGLAHDIRLPDPVRMEAKRRRRKNAPGGE